MGDLPVLFQFKQPTHNVAVFRGADLKNAIASGLVKGFGGAGAGAGAGASQSARDGKSVSLVSRPVFHRIASPPVVRVAPVVHNLHPAPVVAYKPAPVVSYQPKPAVAYQPYVDPYAGEPAVYNYNYAVKDDYTYNDFGASENRDGYLTSGKYVVALPDGRVQTVTYTVDGGAGYVADVTYEGVAQYPEDPAPGYSA